MYPNHTDDPDPLPDTVRKTEKTTHAKLLNDYTSAILPAYYLRSMRGEMSWWDVITASRLHAI